jgi:phage/plasmid primase-like uncharacterized protein
VVDTTKTRKSLKKVSSASSVINGHAKSVVISRSKDISQTAHNTGRTKVAKAAFSVTMLANVLGRC